MRYMSLKNVCYSIYRFFSWPFRKLASCFFPEKVKEPETKIHHTEVIDNLNEEIKNIDSPLSATSRSHLPKGRVKKEYFLKGYFLGRAREKAKIENDRKKAIRQKARDRLSIDTQSPRTKPRAKTPSSPSS
jgi:hypothetical protein